MIINIIGRVIAICEYKLKDILISNFIFLLETFNKPLFIH
jgi:hypothetical protein